MEGRSEYPLTKGAKIALNVMAVLTALLCITIPLAIYFFIRVAKARLVFTGTGIDVFGLMTDRVDFAQIDRVGVVHVPVVARGVGAVLAKMRVGGDVGVNLVFRTKDGKDIKFIVSQFEAYEEIVERVQKELKLELETLQMGMLSPKWPETQR